MFLLGQPLASEHHSKYLVPSSEQSKRSWSSLRGSLLGEINESLASNLNCLNNGVCLLRRNNHHNLDLDGVVTDRMARDDH